MSVRVEPSDPIGDYLSELSRADLVELLLELADAYPAIQRELEVRTAVASGEPSGAIADLVAAAEHAFTPEWEEAPWGRHWEPDVLVFGAEASALLDEFERHLGMPSAAPALVPALQRVIEIIAPHLADEENDTRECRSRSTTSRSPARPGDPSATATLPGAPRRQAFARYAVRPGMMAR